MSLSIFDLFKIGIGPSSSHTVGPMTACFRYMQHLEKNNLLNQVAYIGVDLFGSLALTGRGHATDKAVILGLAGNQPDKIDAKRADVLTEEIRRDRKITLPNHKVIEFDPEKHITFHCSHFLPEHPNGLQVHVKDRAGLEIDRRSFFSIGGGFVVDEEEIRHSSSAQEELSPYPFTNASELIVQCEKHKMSIAQLIYSNEKARGLSEEQIFQRIDDIWAVMLESILRGCSQQGELPGGLGIMRRAAAIHKRLKARQEEGQTDPLAILDWVSLYAIAVNEENATGGRIVTAPTNGAAGVIPAVINYYVHFVPGATEQGVRDFMATASAIGMLYKKNASISAAEVGCQGEIGVACSMAAAGLTAVMQGTIAQIENAAEIGMEHNLGMTCDPVAGLVQVPCIERNTMGAIKAINASRLALLGDGRHRVSLDQVIKTMYETGADMQNKYKETSLGGLAANVVLC